MESTFLSSLKESDALKRKTSLVMNMQKKDHNQLWSGVLNYKFDQFWIINRRLMTPGDDETSFKHIPFRFYICSENDLPVFLQKLVKPVADNGEPTLFKDLIVQTLGVEKLDTCRFLLHGIEPSLDTPIQWMSEHLSYLDNFLHICVHPKS